MILSNDRVFYPAFFMRIKDNWRIKKTQLRDDPKPNIQFISKIGIIIKMMIMIEPQLQLGFEIGFRVMIKCSTSS